MRIYTARVLFPVAGPPLPRGTIAIDDGIIVAVDPHGVRTPDVDLGNVAVIPGLVNAHTHLDLSRARGLIPPTDPEHFTDWLLGVIDYRKTRTPQQVQVDIQEGLAECMKYGTTCIGDIASRGISFDILNTSSCRAIVFDELIGLNESRFIDNLRLHLVWMNSGTSERTKKGCSPHSPYSAMPNLYSQTAIRRGIKATHLAESPAEQQLLTKRSGKLAKMLQLLGVYEDAIFVESWNWLIESTSMKGFEVEFDRSGISHEYDRSSVDPYLLIHCNYLPEDFEFGHNHHIVICPRTHAAFGHPHHPFPQFLARGVRVALGTDSLASNPDLDLLAEAREVRRTYPEVDAATVLRMATLAGAEALGWADVCGSLKTGKSADFVTVPLPDAEHDDPHELVFGNLAIDGPRRTLFRGEWRD